MANISFGKVTVVTPGTPVRLTQNQVDPSARITVHAILIQSHPNNLGKMYIGNISSFVKNGAGQLAWLPVPSANSAASFSETISYAVNAIEANDLWIDADNGNESVIASAVVG